MTRADRNARCQRASIMLAMLLWGTLWLVAAIYGGGWEAPYAP